MNAQVSAVVAAMLFGIAIACITFEIHKRRLREKVTAHFRARIVERERVARELHDALLQGLQGVAYRFQAVADSLDENDEARGRIEGVLRCADTVMERSRLQFLDLRMADTQVLTLEGSLAAVGQELAEFHSATFEMCTHGDPGRLNQAVVEDCYRIGREAVFNAFLHRDATRIGVFIAYDDAGLHLLISDDGDASKQAGRAGDWRVAAMRARAERIGGQLSISHRAAVGTQVELLVAQNRLR